MELLESEDRQLLTYVESVQRQGYTLRVWEFERYAADPRPKEGRVRSRLDKLVAGTFANVLRSIAGSVEVLEEPETKLDYYRHLGWVDVADADQRTAESLIRIYRPR
jgi:hypothetical protein